jgi:modulator of FtsH protease HflC
VNNVKLVIFVIIVLLGIVAGNSSFFILDEGKQAIITQFGKPVGEPYVTAGLHSKVPFVQEVRYVDKRILTWDGDPEPIPTKDKKYIRVDTTARWRIVDPLKFIQTVRNSSGAKARLDSYLDSATRDIISRHALVEGVRNSNSIVDAINKRKVELAAKKKAGESVLEEEVIGKIDKIEVGREKLSEMIVEAVKGDLKEFGISLIDVQLRRISYEKSVEDKVYERMISERQRIAQKIRSIGQGEKAKIEGRLTRDLQEIKSKAYRESEILKGKSEAKATAIYAKALSKDPSFYEFMKSMDLYKKGLKADTKFLLSSDTEFLKYFQKSR